MIMIKLNTRLFLLWFVSLSAISGSIIFQLIGFSPCSLCWIQRICMFCIFILSSFLHFNYREIIIRLTKIFTFAGLFFSSVHVIYEKTNINSTFCLIGNSCAEGYINFLGFISIPVLSFMSFVLILLLLPNIKK